MPTTVDTRAGRLAPEALTWFRLGQLLLLLDVVRDATAGPLDIERLGYYDFFAANPFLIVEPETREHTELQLAGFNARNLDYQSAPQRFSNRRARLQHDLALLVAYGHVHVSGVGGRVEYELSAAGAPLAEGLSALYAHAYRRSARIVINRLKRLSDKRLREQARDWLRAEALLIDLYDV